MLLWAPAKAINAKLWTLDEKLSKRAPQFGVQLAPECNLKGVSGPEDPDAGRQLLGLNPKPVGVNGQVLASNAAGGGNGGTYAVEGVADNTLPEFVGPSAKGQAMVGGIQLAFEGINFVLNLINDRVQKSRVDEALSRIRATVAKARGDNPRLGVLLIFYYTQVQAPEESIMKPGAAFDYLIWGQGITADEARVDALSTPTISRGVAPRAQIFPGSLASAADQDQHHDGEMPLPAGGRRAVLSGQFQSSEIPVGDVRCFRRIRRIREKSVELPKGVNADFAVLKPPSEVYWYNMNGRQTVSVPLKDAKTANSNTIKVVDLDPWSPFNASAAMVFPVTDWTEEVFNTVSSTSNYESLSTYVNFKMVRWVRAENIHLLRFV